MHPYIESSFSKFYIVNEKLNQACLSNTQQPDKDGITKANELFESIICMADFTPDEDIVNQINGLHKMAETALRSMNSEENDQIKKVNKKVVEIGKLLPEILKGGDEVWKKIVNIAIEASTPQEQFVLQTEEIPGVPNEQTGEGPNIRTAQPTHEKQKINTVLQTPIKKEEEISSIPNEQIGEGPNIKVTKPAQEKEKNTTVMQKTMKTEIIPVEEKKLKEQEIKKKDTGFRNEIYDSSSVPQYQRNAAKLFQSDRNFTQPKQSPLPENRDLLTYNRDEKVSPTKTPLSVRSSKSPAFTPLTVPRRQDEYSSQLNNTPHQMNRSFQPVILMFFIFF